MNGIIPDEFGKPLPPDRVEAVKAAYDLLLKLTDHERSLILCWFCRSCNRYTGPGDSCHCWNDE